MKYSEWDSMSVKVFINDLPFRHIYLKNFHFIKQNFFYSSLCAKIQHSEMIDTWKYSRICEKLDDFQKLLSEKSFITFEASFGDSYGIINFEMDIAESHKMTSL